MLLFSLYLILYALVGVTIFFDAKEISNRPNLLLHASLGIVVGQGLSSCLFFVFLIAQWPFYLQSFAEILICGSLVFFGIRKNNISFSDVNMIKISLNAAWKKSNLPILLFLLFFFIGMTYCFIDELHKPNGDWDAYAIWNTQARLIYRGGAHWINLFHGDYSHPDYPLLLGGLIARWWFLLGYETIYVHMAIALLQVALIILILFWELSQIKSRWHALVATLILTSTPFFLDHGSSQYPDTMLSLFFLSSCVFLSMAERSKDSKTKFIFMAGLTASLAVWTKNEGALFLLALLTSQFLLMRNLKAQVRTTLLLVVGALPVLVIVIYFKLNLAPPNDLFIHQSVAIFEKLFDLNRYSYVLIRFIQMSTAFGNGIISPLIVLIIYAILVGKDQNYPYKSYRQIMITTMMIACGYFMIYVITPHDLKWHIDTSIDRLMIQLLPMIVFGSFLYLKAPDILFKAQSL